MPCGVRNALEERAITPSISRDLMEEDVPVLRESTVREPSDHGLIHTGEKARPSRTPQILIYRDETYSIASWGQRMQSAEGRITRACGTSE